MESNPEQRHKARFAHQSSISVEKPDNGVLKGARMFNYNDNGLYFEADFELEPGTQMFIRIDNSPYAPEPDVYEKYQGVVVWQKKLEKSSYFWGYGVKFTKTIGNETSAEPSNRRNQKHPRKPCSVPLKNAASNQDYMGIIKNISKGGLYIESDHPVAVGKKLKLSLPSKKKATKIRLHGKVVWSKPGGFGVEFEGQSEK